MARRQEHNRSSCSDRSPDHCIQLYCTTVCATAPLCTLARCLVQECALLHRSAIKHAVWYHCTILYSGALCGIALLCCLVPALLCCLVPQGRTVIWRWRSAGFHSSALYWFALYHRLYTWHVLQCRLTCNSQGQCR